MRVHFVGVSGAGMGPLAGLFLAAGHEVSGSDSAYDPPMGPALMRWGVRCLKGFDPAHLSPRPDLVVIGNVCRNDNPLARAAIDSGIPYTDMAHALSKYILPGTSPLVVAGTHGKTTTSAMAAWLLSECGCDMGFLLGGLPKNFETSYRLPQIQHRLSLARADGARGRKTPFVIEGDEYDTAFFEKTPKFWHYEPDVAIITSIEHDHVDIYPTEQSYLDAFYGFLKRVPESGLLIASAADPKVVHLVKEHARAPVAWFAIEGEHTGDITPEWLAAPAVQDHSGQAFDLFMGGVAAGRCALAVPGLHNVRNALAALAAAVQGYGVAIANARQALARFEGVRRRQDLLGCPKGIWLYDDFAHHPTAVKETLSALKRRHPESRLIAVFEPRSATACRAMHQRAYTESFDEASFVCIAPRGRAKVEGEALRVEQLVSDLQAKGIKANGPWEHETLLHEVAALARAGDVIVLLSNGSFGGLPERLLQKLKA